MRIARILGLALLTLSVVSGVGQAANLITNGGFETGDFTGWSLAGTDLGHNFVNDVDPHSGTFSAWLGSVGGDAFLSQMFATNPGDSYTLDYFLKSPGGTPNDFAVEIDGVVIPGSTFTDAGAFDYTEFTFTFTATKVSTQLKFDARQDPDYWRLDDVSVTPNTSGAVPEPAPLKLLGIGVLCLSRYAYRRRKRAERCWASVSFA